MTPTFSSATDSDRISRVVFHYAAQIGNARDTQALLHLNADLARDLVCADRCSVWLVDSGSNELWTKVAHGVDEIRIPFGQGLMSACISRNEPIVVNDASADSRFLGAVDQNSGYQTQSVAVIPLRGGDGQIIGALQALNKSGGFSMSDTELLGLAAAYCASAVETQRLREEAEAARRLYHELEIARRVQKQLLPHCPPRVEGLDYAAFCRPARFVGGDYYDFVTLPDGRIGLTLGDVSGKGVAAAVLMSSIQTSLRAQMMSGPDSLADLMMDFNAAVYSFSEPERYSTLFCSLLDLPARKLTYVNAGQIVPLLVRNAEKGARVVHLDQGGLPVGLVRNASYEQATVELEPGDVVLCCSDGFCDAENVDGEDWGDRAIEHLFLRSRDESAEEIINRLVAAADSFTGAAPQTDDMTAVVLRVQIPSPWQLIKSQAGENMSLP